MLTKTTVFVENFHVSSNLHMHCTKNTCSTCFFDSLRFPVADDGSFGVSDLGPLGGQERSVHDFAYIIVFYIAPINVMPEEGEGYSGYGGDFDRFLYPEGGDMHKL